MSDEHTVSIDTGVPGAVIQVEETPEGVVIERNGNGSIVSLEFPFELHAGETPEQRYHRLAAEFDEAKTDLRKARAEQRRLTGKR